LLLYIYKYYNILILYIKSSKSLEEVERNIENFIELLATMEDKPSDEVFKKEDVVIESLEKLSSLNKTLKQLRVELKELIT